MTRSPRSSPERRRLAALVFAGVAGLALLASGAAAPAAVAQGAAASEGGVEARARATLADSRYQRALPNPPEARPEAGDGGDLPTGRPTGRTVGSSADPVAVPLPVQCLKRASSYDGYLVSGEAVA